MEAKREYLIPNGIVDACPDFATVRLDTADRADGPMRVLYVGVMSEAKGVNGARRGLREARGAGRAVRDRNDGSVGERRIRREGQESNPRAELGTSFHIPRRAIRRRQESVVSRADVFCFPTHFECETFGLGLLEAMSFGLPVVASNWRGIPSVVDEGETGFLFEALDADALADRLARLADDRDLRERMGQAGRAKFEREFTFPRHASRMRHAMLETAGVAVEAESEVEVERIAKQRSHAFAPACT